MFELLLALLVVWVVVAVVGAVQGLLWLCLVGTGLFLATAVCAGLRGLRPR